MWITHTHTHTHTHTQTERQSARSRMLTMQDAVHDLSAGLRLLLTGNSSSSKHRRAAGAGAQNR